jgi:hypothetical protein
MTAVQTPDVVDDDDCSAIPLQIPTLELMTTPGTTPAQQKNEFGQGQSQAAAVAVACSLKAQPGIFGCSVCQGYCK